MDYSIVLIVVLLGRLDYIYSDGSTPDQVHIATNSPNSMVIVWNTNDDIEDNAVIYGTNVLTLSLEANGTSTKFVDGGREKRVQYIHEVTLKDLQAETVYYYKVGGPTYGFSITRTFKTWPAGEAWSPKLAVFGDLGHTNMRSLKWLKADAIEGMYDAIIHVGDFAYDMDSDNGRAGDDFMRKIEPLASTIPYMTCPGNHENYYNFSHYKYRFPMPGDEDRKMYYSFKMGPIRFISTNTESMFFPGFGEDPIKNHHIWLEKELKDANLPENRAKQPWVIAFGHRPMYCSNNDGDDCTKFESNVRAGVPAKGLEGWEKMFYENGVDIAIWAHEHSYERLLPLYNRKIMSGSDEEPYTNPRGPVHLITGSAGGGEGINGFQKSVEDWSVFRTTEYGYTRMQVFNRTHVYFEQVSDDSGGNVIDSFWVIKDNHGSFEPDDTPVEPVGDMDKLVKRYMERSERNIV